MAGRKKVTSFYLFIYLFRDFKSVTRALSLIDLFPRKFNC